MMYMYCTFGCNKRKDKLRKKNFRTYITAFDQCVRDPLSAVHWIQHFLFKFYKACFAFELSWIRDVYYSHTNVLSIKYSFSSLPLWTWWGWRKMPGNVVQFFDHAARKGSEQTLREHNIQTGMKSRGSWLRMKNHAQWGIRTSAFIYRSIKLRKT